MNSRRRPGPGPPRSLEESVGRVRALWAVLAQGALWFSGVIGGFLLPPPVGMAAGDDRTWLRFAQFLVAALLGLVLFATFRWHQRKHASVWWLTACGALLLAIVVFFQYQRLLYAWTGEYDGHLVVVGSEFTAQGRAYVERNPNLPLTTLLEDFLGRAEDIWTRPSINQRRTVLAGVYVSCLPLLVLSLIAIVQALRCLGVIARQPARK
jgi:hypothetical protein